MDIKDTFIAANSALTDLVMRVRPEHLALEAPALPPSSLESWPTQASYAARGDWSGLATYNRR